MRRREEWATRSLSRIERENDEQFQTITALCGQLGFGDLPRYLTEQRADLNAFVDQLAQLLDMISNGDRCGSNSVGQVQELEARLAEKKASYLALQGKIAEYVASAQEYDAELARNEREKAEILAGFQQRASASNSTFRLSQLEEELNLKEAEKENLLKEHQEVKELCLVMRDRLKSSKDAKIQLHQQLASVRKHLQSAGSFQLNQIQANELRISELQNELRKARQKIQSLKEDNNMLKGIIADDEDFDI